jgi:L-ascorbate metabolism protein UlaG (beta-lactamase superfamily)
MGEPLQLYVYSVILQVMYLTWLDSNSWLIEMGGKHILLDPWLVGPLVFGNMTWLFKGERTIPKPIPTNIDLILLSQGIEDHSHPATLQKLDKNIPVVASPNAAKVAKQIGFTQVTSLAHHETFILSDRLEIRALPGSPIGPMLVENGYLLKQLEDGKTLYYEPHGFHSPEIEKFAPVDVAIAPIIDLRIPLLGPVIQGYKSALQLAQWLKPRAIVPTAAGGDIEFKGVLLSLLRAEGSVDSLRTSLADRQLATKVMEPLPGQRFAV